MKKSLLALAVLGAFASVASAQSSVTLYGRVDLSVGKNAGSSAKFLQNGSGSRFGVRGVEDLGGGLQALFNIEHRYNADTGGQTQGPVAAGQFTNAAPLGRFWGGRSLVGLQGGFGQVVLGREYTTAFLQSQLIADPWGWDTVAAATGTSGITGGGIAKVRNDSSVTYKISAAGFTFGAQVAEATDAITNVPKKPVNAALSYAAGPLTAGIGFERTGEQAVDKAQWLSLNAAYNLGGFKIGGFYGKGDTFNGADVESVMLTATAPVGAGEFRAAIGQRETNDNKDISLVALGYHYSMSKRTTLYADFARNGELATSKTAYDVGIKHNF